MIINRIDPEVTVLADRQEVPGLGFVPVNAYVLHAEEPVVVDTGLSLPDRDFVADLEQVMDPADVRWIWLTHPDTDHTGGLHALLEAAPRARVVTTFIGVGILSNSAPLPLDRVHLLNPGQSLDVGDRRLLAFRPALFDNPATTGFLEDRSGNCFVSDCFGAPLGSAEDATAPSADGLAAAELRDRQLLWASVDSPWVEHSVGPGYRDSVEAMRALDARRILSSHLPPVQDQPDRLFEMAIAAQGIKPFVGPDQAALEAMLQSFEPAG